MEFKSEVTQIITTYGVHASLAGSSIPWELEPLMASDSCVGIGECGLDDTLRGSTRGILETNPPGFKAEETTCAPPEGQAPAEASLPPGTGVAATCSGEGASNISSLLHRGQTNRGVATPLPTTLLVFHKVAGILSTCQDSPFECVAFKSDAP